MTGRVSVEAFVDRAAEQAGVPRAMITGHGRAAAVVAARADQMLAAYEAGFSSLQIGRAFSKDHTTVLAAIKRARDGRACREVMVR